MPIREIRREEVAHATDLYLEACKLLSERDAEWGVPDRDPIDRWIHRTTESDQAVCLVPDEGDDAIAGLLLASVARHPAMPCVLGMLEELHVRPGPEQDRFMRELVEAGIAWARDRGASPIQTVVGLDAPWTNEELSFWTSMGFEHGQTLVTRYFLEDDGG